MENSMGPVTLFFLLGICGNWLYSFLSIDIQSIEKNLCYLLNLPWDLNNKETEFISILLVSSLGM